MYIFLQEIIHNYSISKSGLLCNLYGILLITEYEIPVLFFSFSNMKESDIPDQDFFLSLS